MLTSSWVRLQGHSVAAPPYINEGVATECHPYKFHSLLAVVRDEATALLIHTSGGMVSSEVCWISAATSGRMPILT